jgi:hypothetical protein
VYPLIEPFPPLSRFTTKANFGTTAWVVVDVDEREEFRGEKKSGPQLTAAMQAIMTVSDALLRITIGIGLTVSWSIPAAGSR